MNAIRFWQAVNRRTAPLIEFSCDILLERSLLDPLPEPRCDVKLDIRLATTADLDLICATYAPYPYLFLGDLAPDGSVPPDVRQLYADRLDRGDLCYIATADGELAHMNWTCFSWGDVMPGCRLPLAPHEIYTTDGVTTAAFRGKNVHPFVLRAMLQYARERGRTHAFTLASWERVESLKGLYRLGWHEAGRVYYLLYADGYKSLPLFTRGNVEPLFRQGRR
jgi:GNAT superfamily N-acetyltransferase